MRWSRSGAEAEPNPKNEADCAPACRQNGSPSTDDLSRVYVLSSFLAASTLRAGFFELFQSASTAAVALQIATFFDRNLAHGRPLPFPLNLGSRAAGEFEAGRPPTAQSSPG